MNRKLLFIPLVLFLLLVAALMVQLTRNAGGEDPTMLESALIGKPVPTFRLESLDQPGKTYDQAVLRDGKPILLNVWATWCPTCRAEHQYLNTLAARGVRVVGLNYKDDRAKAVTWLNSLGNPYAPQPVRRRRHAGVGSRDLRRAWRPSLSTARGLFAIATPAT